MVEHAGERPLDGELVERLVVLTRSFAGAQLVDLLRPLLDEHPVEPLLEYIASRLHRLGMDVGERELRFHLSDGRLRRTNFGGGPVGNQELERLAKA
jgi:hypothetical protein